VTPPDHVDEVLVVELNQHNDVPVVPKLVLVYEDEDPKEDEFEEEENPQEEEDDTEINVEEDENELELTYPYEEDSDSLLPGLMKWDINSLFGQMASISSAKTTALCRVRNQLFFPFRKDKFYGKLILKLRNEVRSTVEQGMAAMEKLVEKLGNTEDKVDCKKLKKEHKEIIMVKVTPPDHVDEVLVVELNQHNDVPVVPKRVLVYEDEDPKEDEFEEE
nr:hypothetical protein [Tanacetum cinerariifolium]